MSGWTDYLEGRADVDKLRRAAHNRHWKRIAQWTGLGWADARELGRHLRERPAATRKPSQAAFVDSGGNEPVANGAVEVESASDYEYNPATRTYVFRLAGVSRHVVLSAARVSAILADYSNVTGRPATINQVARTHDLPRPVVQGILRALGKTHDSLPFTDERLAEASSDELREEARQLRQLDVYRKIERDKWTEYKRDAERWRGFREHVVEPLKRWFAERAPEYAPPKLRLARPREPYLLVVGLSDEHFGKYGRDYDRAAARRVHLEVLERLLGRVAPLGRPEKIVIPIGSDSLHVDTYAGTTTRGTPLEIDGTPLEIAAAWTEYKVEQIDALAAVGPVELWPLQGNHDRFATALMVEAVRGWFSKRPDVTTYGSAVDAVQAQLYGDTLIAMHHGDQLKVRALSEVIPKRFARLWGQSRWRYCFTGHFHTERDLPQKSDLQILRWPSASGDDRWHTDHGFDGTRRAIAAHVVSPTAGVVQAFNEPVI